MAKRFAMQCTKVCGFDSRRRRKTCVQACACGPHRWCIIDNCCFCAKHTALRSKHKDLVAPIRILYPSRTTCLLTGCCSSVVVKHITNIIISSNITCSWHDIAYLHKQTFIYCPIYWNQESLTCEQRVPTIETTVALTHFFTGTNFS